MHDDDAPAIRRFTHNTKNAIKKYDEYIYSTTEIVQKGIDEDLKLFDDALEKKLISQEQYNDLVLGMDKKLKEAHLNDRYQIGALFSMRIKRKIMTASLL